MKKIIFIILVIPMFLFSKEYKIGFAQDTLANDWRVAQVEAVKSEIKKYPFLKLTVRDAKAQVSNQIADIEYFINNNYDFIITSPINPKITSIALKKAIKKNIKIILLDRGIEKDYYTTFIAPDNQLIAKEAATLMVKKMDGKGTILILEGIKGATPTIQRTNGFMSIIKKYSNIKIIKKRANFLRADAIKVMEEIYNNNIKFDAIYSHSDSMLSGVRTVMKSKSKNMDILMVGIDYINESKDAIINGQQSATFTYDTCGKEGIKSIIDIIDGKNIIKNQVINTTMVTKQNVMLIDPIF